MRRHWAWNPQPRAPATDAIALKKGHMRESLLEFTRGHGLREDRTSRGEEFENSLIFSWARLKDEVSFAYSWKLPAYSEAFLLTIDNSSFSLANWSFLLTILVSLLTVGVFCLQWENAFDKGFKRDCKQRSLAVSKKTPTVSKKLPPRLNRG